MNLLKQYFRDVNALIKKKQSLKLFILYNRLCVKNVVYTKIFKIKTSKERILGYTIYYDNFNSFFAMFSEIFLHEIYGDISLSSKKPLIVDCGANIGLATLYFKCKYPSSKIICFEPDPITFKLLKKNCEVNQLTQVILHDKALSDSTGTIKFYSFGNFAGSPGNTINKNWVNFKNVQEYKVECIKLSSLNLKIDLLKLDVEGAEGKIIRDLKESNQLKNIKNINLEYHYDANNEDNSFANICLSLEKENFDFVINPDSLIEDSISVKTFINKRKYVLILNCIKKKKETN